MGCCGGDREKNAALKNDVKWQYVNLDDFKSTSCLAPLAYIYLWIMLAVSVSVYAIDTFVAINLLAFNRWAGRIQPYLAFKYSRWIFAGCIILSFLLLVYRWGRALKVMRGGKVAKSYLDPLAVRVESIRMGKEGRGWKRFLVFAELTKSKKGADYVALFTYYSFEAWLRILLAEAPRQAINGMTLVAYARQQFFDGGASAPIQQTSFVQFWKNVGVLIETDKLQAAIIFGMLWTILIWLISFLSLLISIILYMLFLWHHIPSEAGGLHGYCRMKINRRMERIVKSKTDKALRKENEIRARQEAKAFREGGGAEIKRQPTLPNLDGTNDSSSAGLPPLSRQTTTTTLPEYSSRPVTSRNSDDTLPPMPTPAEQANRPFPPRRHVTNASDTSFNSYHSDAPLMQGGADMGYDRVQTPSSIVSTPWSAHPDQNRGFGNFPPPSGRSFTPAPQRSHTPGAYPARSASAQAMSDSMSENYPMAPIRPGTGMSQRSYHNSRTSGNSDEMPARGMTPQSQYPPSSILSRAPTLPDMSMPRGRKAGMPQDSYFPPVSAIPEYTGQESPVFSTGAPSRAYTPHNDMNRSNTPNHQPPLPRSQTPSNAGTYTAYNPQAQIHEMDSPTIPSGTNWSYRGVEMTQEPVELPSAGSSMRNFNRTGTAPPSRTQIQTPHAQRQPPIRQGTTDSLTVPLQPPTRQGSFDDIIDHYEDGRRY